MSEHATPPVSTAALVAAGAGGDRQALEALIVRYQLQVARLVVALTRDQNHCEDICQTIFVKMVLALPKLRDTARFEPWLFQIARNAARDHQRARAGWRKLFVAFEPAHEPAAAEPEQPVFDEQSIERGMDRLPDKQRSLLRLSLDGRKSYEELARLSNTSVSAVKSRLHRARENLKGQLLTGDPE